MKSGAPRSSSVARSSSPLASAAAIVGSRCGTFRSSAFSTSAIFFVVHRYVFDLQHALRDDGISHGSLHSSQ
jgi:hypothetical protein